MTATTSLTERRPSTLSPVTTESRRTAPCRSKGHPAAGPRRRQFGRVTLGFWMGGIALGVAGCLLGASMPYHRLIAVAACTVWWGVYLGCLGAGVGGLVGLWGKYNPASSPTEEAVGDPWRVKA